MPWLQALDLFALPSWGEEGVPQAIMQAMACALPGRVDDGRRDHRGRRPTASTGLHRAAARRAPRSARALARLRDDAALRARFGGRGP